MSKGPENTFIGSVHKYLPVGVYRMKNHNQYTGGIADVWYSGKLDLWVEYKFIVLPKRDTTVIDLISGKGPEVSYLQQEWLRERHAQGRSVGVIVGCKEGGVWFPGVTWDTTYTMADFRARIVSRKEISGIIEDIVGV